MKTLQQLNAASDGNLRLWLAELVGWSNICILTTGWCGAFGESKYRQTVPDYSKDLNACRAVETMLRGMKAFDYTKAIKEQVVDNAFELITATARQRTCALILTLQIQPPPTA